MALGAGNLLPEYLKPGVALFFCGEYHLFCAQQYTSAQIIYFMAEDAKVSDALWKAIVTWCGGSTKHDCGWIFRQIWSGETYHKTTRLHGPLFLYMKPLQVSGPCTKFCLLTSELANANWESLCQIFADVCVLLLIRLQDVTPACHSGLEHGFMRKEEYIAQGGYFIFHLLLSILIPSFSLIFARNVERKEVFSVQWMPLLLWQFP